MRVALVNTQDRGGPVDLAVGVAAVLAARGDVDVRMVGPPPVSSAGDVESLVVPAEVESKLDLAGQRRLGKVLAGIEPDVVHAHDRRAALALAGLARPGVPFTSTYHGVPDALADWWVESGPMPRPSAQVASTLVADAVVARLMPITVAPSETMARFLRRRLRVPPSRLRVVRNGVKIQGAAAPRDEITTIATVGTFRVVKAVPMLVRAFARIASSRPSLRLVLAGDGVDRSRTENEVRRLGLSDRVTFTGYVTDVPSVLAHADVFALPSVQENLPLALLEAMGAGLPCIATEIAAVPEALRGCGVLIPPGDELALADALASLVDDPARARQLGALAAERARNEFSIERCADEHLALWKEMTAGSRP